MNVTEKMKSALRDDGAIKIERLLDEKQLAACRGCFDYSVAHPSPLAVEIFGGTADAHYNDLGNFDNLEAYKPMLEQAGFAQLLSELWGSEHVWYFGEELFVKDGGKVGRSPWHQDTAYIAATGDHLANVWMSFESLPKKNSLEMIRGSHTGPQYDGSAYQDPNDPTKPVWGEKWFPRLPDIEAQRKADPHSWDVVSWATEPGDVIVCHSGILHGGAPVDASCPTRHTLVLRFFGDNLTYRPLPTEKPDYFMDVRKFDDGSLEPGQPYRSPFFPQLK